MSKIIFGIDVGGTTCKCGTFSEEGELLRKEEIPTRKDEGGSLILPDISEYIKGVLADMNMTTEDVETAAGLVCGIVELAACMQGRKDKTLRGHSFLMHIYRDSSSVICYGRGTVLLQCHMDLTAISGKVLIYCIVYDLIDQMIQSLAGYTSNIHTRSFPDCLQSFQNRDTASIIGLLFCHGYIHFLSYAPFGA